MTRRLIFVPALAIALAIGASCGGKKPPVANPPPPPTTRSTPDPGVGPPPAPPTPPSVPGGNDVSGVPIPGNKYAGMTPDQINENSPLKPIFFVYDSDELDETARKTLNENAQVLKDQKTWIITVEGHCDERGSAEYNLALGDRRALAAKNYLLTLGIAADRIRTVSYGKEFPFDPAHSEAAYKMNRRAHFMLTSN
jgi:peptidoglycan-associated lipoprotein